MDKHTSQSISKTVWFQPVSLEQVLPLCKNTAISHMGIEMIEIGSDFISARMPVDQRTTQPIGLLHGGASVLLAETIGSLAAGLCVDPQRFHCVGLEINANHIRGVRSGWVTGIARPLHIGRSTQIWEIQIKDDAKQLVCISRLTMAVLLHSQEYDRK